MKCIPENVFENRKIQTSPKNEEKMQVFRIFCELLAKMGPGSRINRGITVEMEKARSRALTRQSRQATDTCKQRRNGESPKQGIDTGYYPCFRDFLVQ